LIVANFAGVCDTAVAVLAQYINTNQVNDFVAMEIVASHIAENAHLCEQEEYKRALQNIEPCVLINCQTKINKRVE